MSELERVWNSIERDYHYLDVIRSEGSFVISALEIKKYKEPRLVAKFDTSEDLPDIFKRNRLSILPITRGTYLISDIKTFLPLQEISQKPVGIAVSDELSTARMSDISSESQAINYACGVGLIERFVGETGLKATLDGRQGSGRFDFKIERHSGGFLNIQVDNAQIEIDKCLEGKNSVVIIEGKKDRIMPDFMERQLFYPARMIKNISRKSIKPIFFSYNNGIIDIREYVINDFKDYNSMSLIKQGRFYLYDSLFKITKDVLYYQMSKTPVVKEPIDIPFPQANTFDRVISLLEKLRLGDCTPNELTYPIGVSTTRQSNYYGDAAAYLGLAWKKKGMFGITKEGKELMKKMPYERLFSYMILILSHYIFREVFIHWLKTGELYEVADILPLLIKDEDVQSLKENVYERRASTVRSWVKWIINNLS
jgi:hypothetical protein